MLALRVKRGDERLADRATVKHRLRSLLDPVVGALARLGVPPLAVTLAGLVLSLAAAAFIARGSLRIGGVILIVSGICDTLDGSLARRAGRESVFGAFIDSTIDRITEIAVFGALVIHFSEHGTGSGLAVIACLVAITGSFLTSYTRARAEGLGLACRVGWLERPERVALVVVGLLVGGTVLLVVLWFLALFTMVTALQRVLHVRRLSAAKDHSA
jgi:CDP-diacylglycerol--glycerol-3-phosphate 3-phosphatidyltransferase